MKRTARKLFNSKFFIFTHIFVIAFACCLEAKDKTRTVASNFGLPGVIDLPSGLRFPDGEVVITQQLHKSLARSGISFQALPRLGFSFRYSGHGFNGSEAHGRMNHDRSFDAHLSILEEGILARYFHWNAGLYRNGWYTSEYIAGTKKLEIWKPL